jgi:tetratricopeptide (TPR) repeat protein
MFLSITRSNIFIWFLILTDIVFISVANAQFERNEAPWVGEDFNGFSCDGQHMAYGPFDYSNALHRKNKLPIVESYHFTNETRQLLPEKSGTAKGQVDIGGIEYTLTAFPNHYKALDALVNYHIIFRYEIKKNNMRSAKTSVACYFLRAINYAPDDATVRILFATYLKKIKKFQLADDLYQQAINLEPDNLKFRYSYGLFLVKQNKLSMAKEQAKIIYSEDFPRLTLKQQLKAAGTWD